MIQTSPHIWDYPATWTHYSVYTDTHKHVPSDNLVGDAIPCDLPWHHFPSDPNPPQLATLHHPFCMLFKALLFSHKFFNQHPSKCCLGPVIQSYFLGQAAWPKVLKFYSYIMSSKLHASFGSVSWCLCGMQWKHEITTWASDPWISFGIM
jgi:hypothetical protein